MDKAKLETITIRTALLALAIGLFALAMQAYVMGALVCLLGVVAFVFGLFATPSPLFNLPAVNAPKSNVVPALIVIAVVIIALIIPMCLNPIWNGDVHTHRNQYELLARAFAQGRLDLGYAVDPDLVALDNPYDPDARVEAGAYFHWDSAFYDGKYYMYFGVVPVVILYLPFYLITGTDLVSYHGTQVFTAAYVIGLYLLLRLIRNRFFPRVRNTELLFLFAGLAIISSWYFAEAPALYCTAISSGVCMEVFSLYFFLRAVFVDKGQNRQLALAALGSLFGALAIGCRPTVAIANIMVAPLLVHYLRQNKITPAFVAKIVLAALPYVIIGAALLWYNQVRFGSLLEFGQSYQLTVADQHQYGDFFQRLIESNMLFQLIKNFVWIRNEYSFPGIFLEYFLLLPALAIFVKPVRAELKRQHFFWPAVGMLVTVLVIAASQTIASPYLLERYKSDLLWLLCIVSFIGCCGWLSVCSPKQRQVSVHALRILSVYSALSCIILFLVPNDLNLTSYFLGL